MSTLLEVAGLTAFYGASQALFGVDLRVGAGEVVALMGRNGMGKTTTVKCVCRMMPAAAGRVSFKGADLTGLHSHKAVRSASGLCRRGGDVLRR